MMIFTLAKLNQSDQDAVFRIQYFGVLAFNERPSS